MTDVPGLPSDGHPDETRSFPSSTTEGGPEVVVVELVLRRFLGE
jgi:hypothetical protein